MPTIVSSQVHIFLWSVLGGAAIGFIYDLFRIKRKTVKTGALFTWLEDFLYWVLVALIMFLLVYYSNDGEIRGYIFLGTAIGVVLYALLLSKSVIKTSMFIIHLIGKICRTLWKVISYPVKILLKILRVPGRFIAKKTSAASRRVKRSGKTVFARASNWGRIFKHIRKKI